MLEGGSAAGVDAGICTRPAGLGRGGSALIRDGRLQAPLMKLDSMMRTHATYSGKDCSGTDTKSDS